MSCVLFSCACIFDWQAVIPLYDKPNLLDISSLLESCDDSAVIGSVACGVHHIGYV
jgi:hypothetical protein